MAGTDFEIFLLNHVDMVRKRYSSDWWKYDQLLFTEETRHGVMKNVVAFQDALRAVRRAHPDLHIENCQSGGRMINEFTVLATQSQWLRDGGDTGMDHARSILQQALGAIEFLPPWTCNRWTNNPDRNNPDDDAFTRYYCRCAMAGTWGLVADLTAIGPRQRDIITQEVANYRRLSELKRDYVYDVWYPEKGAPLAGVVFYEASGRRAGVLLCRWDAKDALNQQITLPGLATRGTYRIEDVDTGQITEMSGRGLGKKGVEMAWGPERLSGLLFVEEVRN
jgi:alpha-galactosidase